MAVNVSTLPKNPAQSTPGSQLIEYNVKSSTLQRPLVLLLYQRTDPFTTSIAEGALVDLLTPLTLSYPVEVFRKHPASTLGRTDKVGNRSSVQSVASLIQSFSYLLCVNQDHQIDGLAPSASTSSLLCVVNRAPGKVDMNDGQHVRNIDTSP